MKLSLFVSTVAAACLVVVGCSSQPTNQSANQSANQAINQSGGQATGQVGSNSQPPEMPAEAKKKCGICHAIDRRVIGPAWIDVAAKYKGDPDAVSKIAANITRGGSFGYGGSMPPKGGSGWDDAQIKSISEFIVGLVKK